MDKMLLPTTFVQQLHRHVCKVQQLKPTGKLMNVAMAFLMLSTGLVLVNGGTPGNQLSSSYYDGLCPTGFGFFATKKFKDLTDSIVKPRILADPTLAPASMRLAFHDCFVQGCDASVLLNSTTSDAERNAIPNLTLRGFEVIDAVKAALEQDCPGVFSCADIVQEVALVAQKYVDQQTRKISWELKYGRCDGLVSLATEALQSIPSPFMTYNQLVANFATQGMNKSDLVHLSGAHTQGVAHCNVFSQRLYNYNGTGTTDPALDPDFANDLKAKCPPGNPPNVTIPLDVATPVAFDKEYFNDIKGGKGLLASDDALKADSYRVNLNGASNKVFLDNFANSMKKMTEIKVKLYPNGEIRSNCALRN